MQGFYAVSDPGRKQVAMRDWLIIGCFVVMLMAPCVVALIASKASKLQKEDPATETEPAVAKLSKPAVEDDGNFVRQPKLDSDEMQTVRVVWAKQFDSGEYPRAGGRILRARRRV